MIFAALEAGINAYHFDSADPALLRAAGEALGHVERRLVIASVSLGVGRDFSPISLGREIEQGLHASGLGWFDLAVLDRPGENELPQAALTALKAIRKAGHVRMLGVSSDEAVSDLYVSTGAFDALFTPFHANIEWRVRARMRAALERQMSLFVYGYFPDSLSTERNGRSRGPQEARPVRPGRAGAGRGDAARLLRLPAPDARLDRRGHLPGLRPDRPGRVERPDPAARPGGAGNAGGDAGARPAGRSVGPDRDGARRRLGLTPPFQAPMAEKGPFRKPGLP